MKYTIIATLSLAFAASARPNFISAKRAEFTLKNGQDAIALKCVHSCQVAGIEQKD